MAVSKKRKTLKDIVANRHLVDLLYAHGKIDSEGRDQALAFLYPHDQWKLWISRLLLGFGVALILAGIIFFYAFNWAKIPPMVKLYSVQLVMISCITGAWFYSLQQLGGQLFLLSASVMVGVFMAVFGQIYQAGADAYQLFMMWSLFIFFWTLISNFSAQWCLWVIVSNIYLMTYWEQGVLPSKEMDFLIFLYTALFNGVVLCCREYMLIKKDKIWLEAKWIRLLLISVILIALIIPFYLWIYDIYHYASKSVAICAYAAIVINAFVFYIYRYKIIDVNALALSALSLFAMLEMVGLKLLFELVRVRTNDFVLGLAFVIAGVMTICMATYAVIYLRKVSDEVDDV